MSEDQNKGGAGSIGSSGGGPSSGADLRDQRREYRGEPLRRETISANPFEEFAVWMLLAQEHHPEDATAMVLATADNKARPSVRTVLLKHFDEKGFCWYSNSSSEKGQQLTNNPVAALQFYWRKVNRQVRISGAVELLSRETAEAYFQSRPHGSQISAAVSRQSSAVKDRGVLEQAAEQLIQQHSDGGNPVPCPEDWCGYRLRPDCFEFWQGRENRLHDRLQYGLVNQEGTEWGITRLAP